MLGAVSVEVPLLGTKSFEVSGPAPVFAPDSGAASSVSVEELEPPAAPVVIAPALSSVSASSSASASSSSPPMTAPLLAADGSARGGGLTQAIVSMHRKIQIAAETTVTLVNASPALAPNALLPPLPPRAPVRPPPLPR